MTRTTPPSGASPAARRRGTVLVAVAGAALLALVTSVVVWAGGSGESPTAAGATPTASTDPTVPWTPPPAPPTPEPTGPTDNAEALPPALPAVALDETAEVGDGIAASIERIEAIEGSGTGIGNIGGPALRITVRIVNGRAAPVSLDAVDVTLAHGGELTPAPPLEDPSRAPFSGTVAPGENAEGVYVFSIPPDVRDAVTVSVGYQAGAPFLVFTGSAA